MNSISTYSTIMLFIVVGLVAPSYSMELMQAVEANDLAAARECIARGAKVNQAHGYFNITPLMQAVSQQNREMVKLLLDAHADPNKAQKFGETAAHMSTDATIIKLLVKSGADLGMATVEYNRPLLLHNAKERDDCVSILLRPSLLFGVQIADRIDYTKHLEGSDFDWFLRFLLYWPKLLYPLFFGNRPLSAINKQDELGATRLMYAASLGNVTIVRMLLKQGASTLRRTNDKRMAGNITRHILGYSYLDDEERGRYGKIFEMISLKEAQEIKRCYRTLILLVARRIIPLPPELLPCIAGFLGWDFQRPKIPSQLPVHTDVSAPVTSRCVLVAARAREFLNQRGLNLVIMGLSVAAYRWHQSSQVK